MQGVNSVVYLFMEAVLKLAARCSRDDAARPLLAALDQLWRPGPYGMHESEASRTVQRAAALEASLLLLAGNTPTEIAPALLAAIRGTPPPLSETISAALEDARASRHTSDGLEAHGVPVQVALWQRRLELWQLRTGGSPLTRLMDRLTALSIEPDPFVSAGALATRIPFGQEGDRFEAGTVPACLLAITSGPDAAIDAGGLSGPEAPTWSPTPSGSPIVDVAHALPGAQTLLIPPSEFRAIKEAVRWIEGPTGFMGLADGRPLPALGRPRAGQGAVWVVRQGEWLLPFDALHIQEIA